MMLGYFTDKRPLRKHSQKSLRIQEFETLEGFKMYYAIDASVPSLQGESTDSLAVVYSNTLAHTLYMYVSMSSLHTGSVDSLML